MGRTGVRLLAALAPAGLLAVDPWGWYPFGPIKWLVISVLASAGPAVVLTERRARVPREVAWVVGAFLGWIVLAAALGDDRLYTWTGTPERHLGVLTWVLCALLLATGTALVEREARTVVDGLLVAGLGVGAVAVAEALGWEPDVLDVATRLSSTLGSPAYLGAATGLLLPVAVGVAAGEGRTRRGAVATAASALLAVAAVGSGARAAWVGLLVAALVASVAGAVPVWRAARARPRRAAALAVGGAVALVLVVALSPVGGRLSDATDPDAAGGRGRLDEWRVATNVVLEHPVVGVGPEGYRVAFHEGVDARYERTHGRRQQPDRAHSTPIDLLLAGGAPLLVAWLLLVALVGAAAWRALRAGPWWLRGVAAGLVSHVAGQLLLFPIAELEPVAWLLAGILVTQAPSRAHRVPASARRAGRGEAPPARGRWVGGGLGAVAAVALLAGVVDVVADHRAQRAVDALGRGDTSAALVAADSAAALGPDEVRLHLLAARAAVADQRGFLAGLQRVDDALAVSPQDPIALLQRLTLLVERAEATQTDAHIGIAVREVRDRLRVDDHNAALWRLRARVALLDGAESAYLEAVDQAERLTPPAERDEK